MSDSEGADACDFCKRGRVVTRCEELRFYQWTARGYLSCRVSIPMGTCDECGAKTWGEEAEAIIEEAVRQEYDKLP
jgi:hypothetical protein